MSLIIGSDGPVFTVLIDRPERRNAVNRDTADALVEAFEKFEADDEMQVAVLGGHGGT
ncbi:MAG: enoyl-CoA hydratase, partial [Deltaproteobacteria bacterium]|nr:enoyl-CoA hydratase [Deltaproteobacteria bacterium]